jgi:hypothetical protein
MILLISHLIISPVHRPIDTLPISFNVNQEEMIGKFQGDNRMNEYLSYLAFER